MNEKQKVEQSLFFRHVELHSLGRKEYGSLELTKNHFVFRYHPATKKGEDSGSNGRDPTTNGTTSPKVPSVSTESSGTDAAAVISATPAASNVEQVSTESKRSSKEAPPAVTTPNDVRTNPRKKERPIEMWIAYPLINHCVLRPSHLSGQPVRFNSGSHITQPAEGDELFPPTFGTSDYERPSSDSARLSPYAPSPRPASPVAHGIGDAAPFVDNGRQPTIRLRLKDFRMMALHFRAGQQGVSTDDTARQVFFSLRERTCVDNIEDLHAFCFTPPKEEASIRTIEYDSRREYARMGVGSKAADGPGSAWRITDINNDYSYSATYPRVLCVPRSVSDNLLKYGGTFRSRCRIPCLSYLHPNGGSITRSSQPMVGLKSKRNPQDERLVSAIFSSHIPPSASPESSMSITSPSSASMISTTVDPTEPDSRPPGLPVSQSDTALNEAPEAKPDATRTKIYGSTRRNIIVDARPQINAFANRATGGGIEDIANYRGNGEVTVEKVFLNVANIHGMRASLEKVVDSFANSDYLKMKPDQEVLRKSGWLGHIAGLLEGTEMIARVVGLGGSHALVHCSDGWDRTAQISGLAQIMLDPHSRTLNGFISLVQKEFLSFGHKFRDRNGIAGSEKWFEIENERIAPSRNRENNNSDPSALNKFGAKALTGARSWFEKGRGNLFRQQNSSQDSVAEDAHSRPPSPPPNPLVHSPPSSTTKDERGLRVSEQEVAPIFHQFLDTVYQLLYQNPNAFEFNERFLRRLFYHAYSCQYVEFLFNSEKERSQKDKNVGSVWSHFLSRREQFTNPSYVAKVDDPLLFPGRSGPDRAVEVRWWNELFGRSNEEMNTFRALTRVDAAVSNASSITVVSVDETSTAAVSGPTAHEPNSSMKTSASTPNLNNINDGLHNDMSSLHMSTEAAHVNDPSYATAAIPSGDPKAFEDHRGHNDVVEIPSHTKDEQTQVKVEYDGDPLGVSGGLDVAAFAAQTAFRDR